MAHFWSGLAGSLTGLVLLLAACDGDPPTAPVAPSPIRQDAVGGEADSGNDAASSAQAPDASASSTPRAGTTAEPAAANGEPGVVATVSAEEDAAVTGAPVPPPAAGTVQAEASQITSGGHFTPLNDPRVVLPEAATWLRADTLVLGAMQNGDVRAYPVFMMVFHHVTNDVLGGLPYLVTF